MASQATRQLEDTIGPIKRYLALEIRSRRFGFAVLQGTDLLDCGARSYPAGAVSSKVAVKKLALLLKVYAPSIVIVRQTRRLRDSASDQAARVLKKIRAELKRRSTPLVILTRSEIRKFFAQRGCQTKHDIALLITNRFRSLKSRLPRQRKAWEPERRVFTVFDAVAAALVFDAG